MVTIVKVARYIRVKHCSVMSTTNSQVGPPWPSGCDHLLRIVCPITVVRSNSIENIDLFHVKKLHSMRVEGRLFYPGTRGVSPLITAGESLYYLSNLCNLTPPPKKTTTTKQTSNSHPSDLQYCRRNIKSETWWNISYKETRLQMYACLQYWKGQMLVDKLTL